VRAPNHAYIPLDPQATFEIGGQRWNKDQPGFAQAIAFAYEQHLRPRCLCQPDAEGRGIEMYVARLLESYIVKRMPNTGSQHATHCPSYEPPADLSGLGPLLGTAIFENPSTGETTLRLDFPMSKMPRRSNLPVQSTAKTTGNKLTLRGLLHYLWDQAGMNQWKPGFAGRRSWGTVRRYLLQAAERKFFQGHTLLDNLYIPEVFSVAQRCVIHTRQREWWTRGVPTHGHRQPLTLMVAEIKEISPARHGHIAVIKHLPDQAFALNNALFQRLGRNFERELNLWGKKSDLHLIMIATLWVDEAGTPGIVDLSLMLTTAQWLPVEDDWDRQLVAALVFWGRGFVKTMGYNAPDTHALVCASLLDCGATPCYLLIDRTLPSDAPVENNFAVARTHHGAPVWRWSPGLGDMPPLPRRPTWTSPGKQVSAA
jgi:hypothetical protein